MKGADWLDWVLVGFGAFMLCLIVSCLSTIASRLEEIATTARQFRRAYFPTEAEEDTTYEERFGKSGKP